MPMAWGWGGGRVRAPQMVSVRRKGGPAIGSDRSFNQGTHFCRAISQKISYSMLWAEVGSDESVQTERPRCGWTK